AAAGLLRGRHLLLRAHLRGGQEDRLLRRPARPLLHRPLLVVQVIEALVRKHGPAFAVYLVIGGVSALVEWAVFWMLLRVAPADLFAALKLSANAAGALRLTVYAAIAFVV